VKGSEICVSTSMDAAILLVTVNLTNLIRCVSKCSLGLIFIWEQSMFWNMQLTYFALCSYRQECIVESMGSVLYDCESSTVC